jgi:RHS repeat-associated protein
MYDEKGEKTWETELDIYGKVRTFAGRSLSDCPFRYQGQYEDIETGLYYNRFRYYSPDEGMYLSKDPIGLAGNNPTLYGYVKDVNSWVDVFGLEEILTSGTVYRGGSGTLNNLTPAFPKDASSGLSTFIEKPASGKFQTIDIAKLQGTGLEAVKDGENHVSIRPIDDPDKQKLTEWAKTKGTEVEHEFSKAVKNACH